MGNKVPTAADAIAGNFKDIHEYEKALKKLVDKKFICEELLEAVFPQDGWHRRKAVKLIQKVVTDKARSQKESPGSLQFYVWMLVAHYSRVELFA